MSERKTNDADVQTVVRSINYVTDEVTLRQLTQTWSEADFFRAIDLVRVIKSKEIQDQILKLYWNLRKERQETDARIVSEEASIQRHNEIARRLDELKKPHWSIVPNFRE